MRANLGSADHGVESVSVQLRNKTGLEKQRKLFIGPHIVVTDVKNEKIKDASLKGNIGIVVYFGLHIGQIHVLYTIRFSRSMCSGNNEGKDNFRSMQ